MNESRFIDDHRDGHGLNESISIQTDAPDASGAAHSYGLSIQVEGEDSRRTCGYIQFQKGPRNVEGSTPGATEAALLTILIDRLRGFQSGPYACRENAIQLTHLEEALMWTKKRADDRAKRGVLGRNAK